MRECWINVYCEFGIYAYGNPHATRSWAIFNSFVKPIYRIHVKMKPIYVQQIGRAKRHA